MELDRSTDKEFIWSIVGRHTSLILDTQEDGRLDIETGESSVKKIYSIDPSGRPPDAESSGGRDLLF